MTQILAEASTLTPYEKMQAFNAGQRRENVRACGDQKLIDYRRICANNNFYNALDQIETEMVNRGLISQTTAQQNKATANSVYSATVKPAEENIDNIFILKSDILLADVSFVKMHRSAAELNASVQNSDIMSAYDKLKITILYLIYAILLKYTDVANDLATIITVNEPDKKQELKALIQRVMSDKDLVMQLAQSIEEA